MLASTLPRLPAARKPLNPCGIHPKRAGWDGLGCMLPGRGAVVSDRCRNPSTESASHRRLRACSAAALRGALLAHAAWCATRTRLWLVSCYSPIAREQLVTMKRSPCVLCSSLFGNSLYAGLTLRARATRGLRRPTSGYRPYVRGSSKCGLCAHCTSHMSMAVMEHLALACRTQRTDVIAHPSESTNVLEGCTRRTMREMPAPTVIFLFIFLFFLFPICGNYQPICSTCTFREPTRTDTP